MTGSQRETEEGRETTGGGCLTKRPWQRRRSIYGDGGWMTEWLAVEGGHWIGHGCVASTLVRWSDRSSVR